jgi:hypothetical protein
MKKKITVSPDLLTVLATADLTTYHYKLWLLYATEPMTQAQAKANQSIFFPAPLLYKVLGSD